MVDCGRCVKDGALVAKIVPKQNHYEIRMYSFCAHMEHINQLMTDPFRMMGLDMMSPFGPMISGPSHLGITDGRERQRDMAYRGERAGHDLMLARDMSSPFVAPFGNMFQNVNSVMGNMHEQMERVSSDPNAHYYSQSSVMSYSNTGQGPPKVFQATTSTRQAPGGIRETRKAVRDSEAAIEKMAIGRHIGEKGHVQERTKHVRTGDVEENQEFINLDEEEAPVFDEEWRTKTQKYSTHDRQSRLNRSGPVHAITDGQTRYAHYTQRSRPYPQRPDHGRPDVRLSDEHYRDRSNTRSPSQNDEEKD